MIYLEGKPVNVTVFSDNTSQVWKLPETTFKQNCVHILWQYSHEGEFVQLAQLKALLDQEQVNSWLEITYLPYARQDKKVANDATFALCVFAKLLNSLNFVKIKIHDPHSVEATTRIHRAKAVYPTKQVQSVVEECAIDLVCYPDKGALSKYIKVYDYPHIFGEKNRDQLTGHILSYQLVGECYGKNVLIIDDICDYGRTFMLLAKDLRSAGAKSVVLFVTHGLFSGGINIIKNAGIDRIYTAHGEALGDRVGSPA